MNSVSKSVGLITIGESPRPDIIDEIRPIIGFDVRILECGALDGLSIDEIKSLEPRPGDYVLVTRLRSGVQVKLSRDKIIGKMQKCINRLEDNVDVIGLLCTGDFPELKSRKLMIEPSKLIMNVVASLSGMRRLGVIVHDKEQVGLEEGRWSRVVSEVVVVPVSAYLGTDYDFKRAAAELRNTDLIILDSLGYNTRMANIVREVARKPVLLPRVLMAHVLRTLIA
ncbi:MAG: AroM family protein [Vulcanisaeta sp.]|uniref:AroM family protein n=1 Tax=Vulcanisaeta sp. TaxID=2020871 RepID=UPI003D12AD40